MINFFNKSLFFSSELNFFLRLENVRSFFERRIYNFLKLEDYVAIEESIPLE